MELLRWKCRAAVGISCLVALLWILSFDSQYAHGQLLDESEVASIVRPLVDQGLYVGIAIGLVDRNGQAVYGFGSIRKGEIVAPDRDTVFALASISKVFTGTLLADTVQRGRIRLNEPIGPFLPPRLTASSDVLNRITFLDLATHTSGLPTGVPRKQPTIGGAPQEPMTLEEMYAFLSTFRLPTHKKPRFRYSNLGFALLGHTLELVNHQSYDDMLQERVCGPLEMHSTRAWASEQMRRRLAQGYNRLMEPSVPQQLLVGKGSGGLYSTAGDMLKFLAANLGLVDADIVQAMQFAQVPRRRVNEEKNAFIGLGWQLSKVHGTNIISKNGGIQGFQCYVAFNPQEKVGVIALANTRADALGLDRASRSLLLRMIEKSRSGR